MEDSNILARHNPDVLSEVQQEAAGFLREGGAYSWNAAVILRNMDKDYINRNISAGGCADLLATAILFNNCWSKYSFL
ncbi:MAG: triphosphoribosyl-dephospho-CoA synthase [Lachnospiraceae bacterium]